MRESVRESIGPRGSSWARSVALPSAIGLGALGLGACGGTDDAPPQPPPAPETSCINGVDDDQDGAKDCVDPDCAASGCCAAVYPIMPLPPGGACTEPEVLCGNGVDDDRDGLTDCLDPNCAGLACCTPYAIMPCLP